MKNILSVKTVNGCVCTEFSTFDGATSMEIHSAGLHDSKVLNKILERKFYQHLKGEWVIKFPESYHEISKPTFESLIDAAQVFIFSRDNSFKHDDSY